MDHFDQKATDNNNKKAKWSWWFQICFATDI